MAQDNDSVAALDELIRGDRKRLPVVPKLGKQLLDVLFALGRAVVRDLRCLGVLPADVVREILGGTVQVSPPEGLIALLQGVGVRHGVPPSCTRRAPRALRQAPQAAHLSRPYPVPANSTRPWATQARLRGRGRGKRGAN